ncbi:MAG: bifunctional adenosylcobinamide kinase/adenosylcobinamide-phosphate guanylyltransferase [Lysinibacillus sp.]
MHVFIGGAYNGKHQYVNNLLNTQQITDIVFADGALPQQAPECEALVVSSIEKWLVLQNLDNEDAIANELVRKLKNLDELCHVYVIVTDMGRGVVPMEKQVRQLRDVCGRFYQALFTEAESVTRIWYGIAEKIKE